MNSSVVSLCDCEDAFIAQSLHPEAAGLLFLLHMWLDAIIKNTFRQFRHLISTNFVTDSCNLFSNASLESGFIFNFCSNSFISFCNICSLVVSCKLPAYNF